MEWDARAATKESFERLTVWGALGALALGTLLGSIGVLCSRWAEDSPLLCLALQSAVSTMTLAVLASARPQDLTSEIQGLQRCPEIGHRSAQETQDVCWQGLTVQPGFGAP